MDFFDHLGKRLGEVAKHVEEKSGELFEVSKLNLEIFREEEAIRKLCRRIGELVYEAYSAGSNNAGEVDAHCMEINTRKIRIVELKNKIETARKSKENVHNTTENTNESDNKEDFEGIKVTECPYCGTPNPRGGELPVCEVE